MGRMDDENETPGGLNLAERIRRLANGRATLDVAQFQFIGIADIRARYGERWPERRDRVNQVARHFISRRIAPDDVLIAGADGFLLVFGSFSGMLADTAAQRISRELNAFFLGDPDLDAFAVNARHLAMSVDDFAAAFGALLAAERTPPAPRTTSDITMGWIPVWEARREALATYFITPMDTATGLPLDWDIHSHRHADMDEQKLQASEAAMGELFTNGKRALVGVAVHASSLNSQQALLRMTQTMARFDRKMARYRVLRVSCVEPGYPRIYLEDMMRTIRPMMPRIAIGLNWTEPDLTGIVKLKPAAIGFTIPPRALTHAGLQADVFSRIAAAVQLARPHGVQVGVEGDIQPEHAARFRQDGVTHICSPRIWPVRAELPPGELWPASRLGAPTRTESAA